MKTKGRVIPVRLSEEEDCLVILDQTRLPAEEEYIHIKTEQELRDAIISLKVRGAPAIGIAAALGMYVLTKGIGKDFYDEFKRIKESIASTRPTAVNLFRALDRMEKRLARAKGQRPEQVKEELKKEALSILAEDEQACAAIGKHALSLLRPGMGILTHCNAGGLATSGYGTALAPIYLGQESGYGFRVYADETRPLLQGARLTVWELMRASVNVTLICDSAAASVMKDGKIQAVLVGCDRVALNGDTANKIGTLMLAVLAKEYSIPFYVCCPLSTIDEGAGSGNDIRIEERDGGEIYKLNFVMKTAPEGAKTLNPAFDITEGGYISAFITEHGIICPPFADTIKELIDKSAARM